MTTRVALIQLNSGTDRTANLAAIEHWVLQAAAAGAKLIITPEYSDVRGDTAQLQAAATPLGGVVTQHLAALAQRTGCWIHLGSFHERMAGDTRLGNTSVLLTPQGEIAATYRKLHLYDATVNGMPYREGDDFVPGDALVTAQAAGVALGLSICYDLRFAEQFRALRARGAQALVVPAAFNVHTGRDHWEVLLRARAIENQCYVLAAGQIGGPGPRMPSYGRSMVVDPWGTVVACMPDVEGFVCADLDLARVASIREQLPAWQHRRMEVYGSAME